MENNPFKTPDKNLLGKFKLKSKTNLNDVAVDSEIQESDYAIVNDKCELLQYEYIEPEEHKRVYEVTPGIWTIKQNSGKLVLERTQFTSDAILDEFVHTKNISDKVELFFKKKDIYKKHNYEVPRRGMLLYGTAGTGKSTAIKKLAVQHSKDNCTAIIIWPTDAFEAYDVKNFISSFDYKGVDKMILVAEDIGGVEIDQVRMKSDSSLLSLLDNVEKTFSIPVMIIATTNFPENFLGNLTNRRGRFDDKIEVHPPNGDQRAQLLKYFTNNEVSEALLEEIKKNKYKALTPADLKDIAIRKDLYDKTYEECLSELMEDIALYEKNFSKKSSTTNFL